MRFIPRQTPDYPNDGRGKQCSLISKHDCGKLRLYAGKLSAGRGKDARVEARDGKPSYKNTSPISSYKTVKYKTVKAGFWPSDIGALT